MPKATLPEKSPADLEKLENEALVEFLYEVAEDLEATDSVHKSIKAELVKRGFGQHAGTVAGHVATVCRGAAETTKYKLKPADVDEVRAIAGKRFDDLFQETKTYEPKEGFKLGVDVIELPPRTKKRLLALVTEHVAAGEPTVRLKK